MELSVRDSAKLLNVSEKTVYRWAKQGDLPACRVNEQYRFNRADLLEWANARGINLSADLFSEPVGTAPAVSLADAVRAGGVYHEVEGGEKTAALRDAVTRMPLPREVDRDFVLQLLLARESLGSTAIGRGIALPHVRNPVVMHVPCPMITVCFLKEPIEFGALDGEPVTTLFTMLSPTVRAHLHTLARLSFALQRPEFAEVISRRANRGEVLAACEAIDRSVSVPSPAVL